MDKSELETAAKGALYRTQVLEKLGLEVTKENRKLLAYEAERLGVKLPNRARNGSNPRSDEEILVKGEKRNRRDLHPRMRKEGVPYICALCKSDPLWNGKELVLQVDHIDGDKTNNVLENLRFLCPNCHSQCETSFNRKTRTVAYSFNCVDCNRSINSKAYRCASCYRKKLSQEGTGITREERIAFPPIEEIVSSLKELGGWSATARKFAIGENTLRKHLRRNGVDPKSIVYNRRLPSK